MKPKISTVYDDKSEHCITFIIECLAKQGFDGPGHKPLCVGLNGAQGSGKTTLASIVAEKLRQPPHSLSTIILSIDDLYLTHQMQCELASNHPDNPLIQHRGQPSTHDLPLALSLFSDLSNGRKVKIPCYDKSAYSGQGDRAPRECWDVANEPGRPTAQVVILEGWCVAFRALSIQTLKQKWEDAAKMREAGRYHGRLGMNRLEDVGFVNEALRGYDRLTHQFDVLIHLDAVDLMSVYSWRQQQERALRETEKAGMTDEQIKTFVDGYYPSYELYTEGLRAGVFSGSKGRQLRLIIGEDRRVMKVVTI